MARRSEKGMHKVTMQDVAARAGVSYQTVSRVLNNSCNVSDATRAKIEKAIAELKYVPNMLAQQMGKKERKVIGLINISAALTAPSYLSASIRRYCKDLGYEVFINLIDVTSIQDLHAAIRALKSQLISKIIINVPLATADARAIAAEHDDVVILFMDVDPDCDVYNLTFDAADGTAAAVEYLYGLGHRSLALLPGPPGVCAADLRLKSWLETMKRLKMRVVMTEHGDWTTQSGFNAAMKLCRQAPSDFTAMLIGNDQMALGALSALWQLGLRVPEDISVIGYDNDEGAAFFVPPLTTVAVDHDYQCRVAADKLILHPEERISRKLKTELIVRGSCAAPRQSGDSADKLRIAAALRRLASELEGC